MGDLVFDGLNNGLDSVKTETGFGLHVGVSGRSSSLLSVSSSLRDVIVLCWFGPGLREWRSACEISLALSIRQFLLSYKALE